MTRRLFATITITIATALVACHDHDHDADHGHEPEEGAGHGHAHGPPGVGTHVFTHFTDETELFVEIPALIVGKTVQPAIHLTWLSDFGPVRDGAVTFALGGQTFTADVDTVPGIFRPGVTPTATGEQPLEIRWARGEKSIVHVLPPIPAWANAESVKPAPEPEEGDVAFLKEQQWRTAFGLAEAKSLPIRPSFEAYGTMRPRADGEAHVASPFAGRIATGAAFPRIGQAVKRGQLLARVSPRLGDQGDAASLERDVQRAQIAVRRASREQERLDGLLKSGAVAERRAIEARFSHEQAMSELEAAKRRARQARLVQSTGAAKREGSIEVRAPLAGTLVEVKVVPGAFVEAGAHMFRIVDLSELWLEVHVPEAHARELADARGVWFTIEGAEAPFEAAEDAIVTIGGVVDPHSRTLPLYVKVPNNGARLKVGMFADVRVVTSDGREAITIPVSAIVREGSLSVVYVQKHGESFERRYVRLGVRDRDRIEVVEGVEAGERVVSRGAYAVKLASSSGAEIGHGHAH